MSIMIADVAEKPKRPPPRPRTPSPEPVQYKMARTSAKQDSDYDTVRVVEYVQQGIGLSDNIPTLMFRQQ